MQRCIFCNLRGGDLEPLEVNSTGPRPGSRGPSTHLVHPEHRAAAERYFARVDRHGSVLVVLLLALALLPLAAIPFEVGGPLAEGGMRWVLALSLGGMGVAVTVWPFCTPQTLAMFGIQRSITIARVIGVLMLVLGLAAPWLLSLGG